MVTLFDGWLELAMLEYIFLDKNVYMLAYPDYW
jgi:hypothetical protein